METPPYTQAELTRMALADAREEQRRLDHLADLAASFAPGHVDEVSDVDPMNPVDVSADCWRDIYAYAEDAEGLMDSDMSMNY